MARTLRYVGMSLLGLATCHEAAAQSSGFVGINLGGSYERAEDGLSGGTGGAGLAAGIRLSRNWTGEFDLWLPGFIREADEGKHRDTLISLIAVRTMDAQTRPRPYVLIGVSFGRTETSVTSCIAERETAPTIVDCTEPDVRERRHDRYNSESTYALVGAGFDLPVWRRVHLAPEVRVHLTIGSVIIRSAVGLRMEF
jgi:hypothetical protein